VVARGCFRRLWSSALVFVRSRFGACVLLTLGAGCAAAVPPPAEVAERARSAPFYSASLRVSLRGPHLRGGTRALVAFRRPDALRIEIPGPAGARLLAVAAAGTLVAVFPADAAVLRGAATAEEMDALLGVGLSPAEIIDLLVGVPSPRLRAYGARWGPSVPKRIDATLPDGTRLEATIDSAQDRALPAAAFEPPPAAGFREVDVAEARRLMGIRSSGGAPAPGGSR
jgi:hypothetical protein